MTRRERLRDLAYKRQRARWPGYKNVGDFHGGAYECDHVSPYTKSADNVDAEVMVVLQDWRSEGFMLKGVDPEVVALGHTPSLPTNRNLKRLLREHLGLALSEVYATNLFPFIKPGGMSSKVPRTDLERAALEYGLPQVEIVGPRLVICLGLDTFNALRGALGLVRSKDIDEAIRSPFPYRGSLVYCQAHTGSFGQMNRNRRGRGGASEDWGQMARAFAVLGAREGGSGPA